MGFWGIVVKPGETKCVNPQTEEGKLHLTRATLGSGSGKDRSVVQVSVGDSDPINLCSLLPNKNESCSLNHEFDDDDESVEFSVIGKSSVHLTGYLEAYDHEDEQDEEDDEDDSDGINMGESESSDYDSEEEEQMDELEEFLDSNLERYRRASVPSSGVVIEEIEDEEKPAIEDKKKQPKKKIQASEDDNLLESEDEDEDEDGFPISKGKSGEPENKKAELDDGEQISNKKRKAKAFEQDAVPESVNKNKKKKNQKEKKKGENAPNEEADKQVKSGNAQKKQEPSQTPPTPKAQRETVNNAMSESSKKNKKKNKNSNEETKVESKASSSSAEKPSAVSTSKTSHQRTYPNGLVVEEIAMGKPNAKKANPGSQVSVRYIGKLQKNGKIFDSNIGKAPFKFRLGLGEVIKGWDVGVNGMRVGDKRKLTIPPSMGYGTRGAGGQIPPNAWLVFDVELINVK